MRRLKRLDCTLFNECHKMRAAWIGCLDCEKLNALFGERERHGQ
jgi:hypothetical protein